ncbi:GIY-YIG nuclease family protein [Leuconostocaceae bacterium ESL0958]|nr:GIY-YIG nuclease family protein [Leuconostocaceae bacterium ESL0958]
MDNQAEPVTSKGKSYDFYVLYTADGYFYGGYSDNAERRFVKHQQGQGAKFTKVKSRHPLQLIYVQSFTSKHDAMSAEAKFKRLTRPQKEAFLLAAGVAGQIWQSNGGE